jgi:hypothetical protein
MSSLRPVAHPGSVLTASVLAAGGGSGYGDFIAGLLTGASIGFLLRPAVRSWLAHREWTEASRQARLTDKVLARMQQDAGLRDQAEVGGTWPPSP